MATQTYVNGVTLSDATEFNRFDTLAYQYLTGVAGTNTITATGPANMTLATPQVPFVLVPANTNTGATTLNITPSGGAALGAKNVFYNGVALVKSELRAGVPYLLIYDGTQYHIISEVCAQNTFTPGISFGGGTTGITYTSQVGTYTKIGRMVMFVANVTLSAKGSSTGTAVLTGLPFTAAAFAFPVSIVGDALAAGATTSLQAAVSSGNTTVDLYQYAAGTLTGLDDADFTNTSQIRVCGVYTV